MKILKAIGCVVAGGIIVILISAIASMVELYPLAKPLLGFAFLSVLVGTFLYFMLEKDEP